MKKLLLTLLFAYFAATWINAQEMPPLVIRDLSGGVVNNVDATLIPNNAVSEARNVYFDEEYPASKRKGMTKLNSTAVGDGLPVLSQFEYKMSNGTRYHIVHSSTNVYYRLSGSAFTSLFTDASATYPANYCVFMDTLTIVDGVSNMKSWDTSTVFTQNSTYQPRYIIVWQNRIWIAGDAGERSTVRCSEWLDPRDYTVPASPASTDPAVFDINSQDGQKVMGFALSPNGGLLIFKEKSVWEISGYDRDDFYLHLILNDIGCVDSRSVAYKDGSVIWLSDRGFMAYNGQSYSIISDNISNTVDSIQQLNADSYSFQKNTYDEWVNYSTRTACDLTTNEGSLYPLFSDTGGNGGTIQGQQIVYGNNYIYTLYVSSYSQIMCTRYNLTTGDIYSVVVSTYGHFNISGLGGKTKNFAISKDSTTLHVVYFRDNPSATPWDWIVYYSSAPTSDLSTWSTKAIITATEEYTLNFNNFVTLDVNSHGDPVIIHTEKTGDYYGISLSSWSSTDNAWDLSNPISSTVTWKFGNMAIDDIDAIHFVGFTGNDLMYLTIPHDSIIDVQTKLCTFSPTISHGQTDIDTNTSNYPQVIAAGNSQTRLFVYDGTNWDEDILDRVFNYPSVSIVCPSTSSVDYIYGYDDELYYQRRFIVSDTTSTENQILDIKFIRYSPTICLDYGKNMYLGYTKDSTYDYYICSSTNNYVSQIYDTGQTGTYYFDQLLAEQSVGDYNINHYIRSDDSEVNIATNTWTAVTVNNVPSITAKQYIQYRCIISTDYVSDSLSYVNSVSIGYHGVTGSAYISSMYYDDRIWNAVSISSATYLDRQLVWDSNGAWADMWSSIGCSSLFNYNGTPYWGSNAGYIYTMDTGESDGGNAIPSYIITKAYDFGTLVQQKTLDAIFVQADDSGNWNLSLDYYLDRSGTAEETHSIDLDQTANLINYKVPFTETHPFYTLQYKLSNNGADEPWDFLGLFTFTRPLPLR